MLLIAWKLVTCGSYSMLRIAYTIEELREFRESVWKSQKRIALVPTMGALHAGHMELVRQAGEHADSVIVSIFVNPLQFGPNEDFSKYPRTLAADMAMLSKEAKIDCVFVPNIQEIYANESQTIVSNSILASQLCGKFRPGHFDGVMTVVLKLLNFIQPDFAVFGQKDMQQLRLIQQMVKDLGVPVGILESPTVRESDGLAMSSRNTLLSTSERSKAPNIYKSLQEIQKSRQGGQNNIDALLTTPKKKLTEDCNIDYLEIRKKRNLEAFEGDITEDAVVLFAGKIGAVRLIDNLTL
jgi:pantoate--beta-alanine ligase